MGKTFTELIVEIQQTVFVWGTYTVDIKGFVRFIEILKYHTETNVNWIESGQILTFHQPRFP